jgi:hypothetical protein
MCINANQGMQITVEQKILKCIAVLRYQRSMEGKYNQLNEIK